MARWMQYRLAGSGVGMFALVVLAAGCLAPRVSFVPVGPGAHGYGRYAGAYHDLSIGGEPVGKVRVWSEGVTGGTGTDKTVLRAGLRVHNDSESTVRIDAARTSVELYTRDGRTLVQPATDALRGPTEVPPGATGRVQLVFGLPEGARARDIAAYEVQWAFSSSSGRTTVPTPFQRADRRFRPYPVPYLATGYPFLTFGFWHPYFTMHSWYPLPWYRPGLYRWAPPAFPARHVYQPRRRSAPRPAPGLKPRRPKKKD